MIAIYSTVNSMAQLLVRKLDEKLVQKLKQRAAKNGRSVEAEHRLILEAALFDDEAEQFKNSLLNLGVIDADLPISRNKNDKGRNIDELFS